MGVLENSNERAWFIKDIYLYESIHPDSAFINLSFRNNLTLIVNNTIVFDSTTTAAEYWNKDRLNIYDYLNYGRNRIAVTVRTLNQNGGFDCELVIGEESKIKRGDQNWDQDDAKWWYYYFPVNSTVPTDTLQNRMWYTYNYGLTAIDTVTANWVFENTGSDTLFDSSPYGRRAILHNISWISGVVGEAMQFDGNNSYVELNTNLNTIPQIIDMWINSYGARSYRQNVVSNIGNSQFGQGLFLTPEMNLGVYFYNGEYIIPGYQLETNIWYNLSIQYDYDYSTNFNIVKVYANNILIGSTSYELSYASSSANTCYLGGNPLNPTSSSFYGAMDELKIKNTVSSVPAIPQIATLVKQSSDTVAVSDSAIISVEIYPSPFKILSGNLKYYPGGSSENGDDLQDIIIEAVDTNSVSPVSFVIPKENLVQDRM